MGNQVILLDGILNDFYQESNFINIDMAFEYFATEQILKDRDLGIDEISSGLIGDSRDGGMDGVYVFLNGDLIIDNEQLEDKKISREPLLELYILQYKNTKKIEELVLDRFLGSVDFIYDLGIEDSKLEGIFNEEIVTKICLFQECWKKTASKHPTIKVYYNHVCKGLKVKTLGPENTNEAYINKKDRLIEKVKEVSATINDVIFSIYDANDLLDLFRKKQSYSLEIKLNENPISIDYMIPNTNIKKGGYIASVEVGDYREFITDEDGVMRKYLFESNIRDYQNKTEVNKSIENSLRNDKADDFWWLNNGVTIIAEKGSLTGKSLNLDNVQIVNGLQTSHNIYNVDIESGDKRSVLLKIVITDDKATKDKIIKSTNSQNYVHPSLFRATDSIQRNIEDYLLKEGFYYDRRKNFYKNQGKPLKAIVSINYMAQCITTIVEKDPSRARQSPASLTKNEKTYNRIFNKGRELVIYLISLEIVKGTENYFKEKFEPTDELETNIMNNFKFHVARIIPSVIYNKPKYNDNDIKSINIKEIDEDVYIKSINLLKDIIVVFREDNVQQNIINIAKNSSFSNEITTYLKSYFNDNSI